MKRHDPKILFNKQALPYVLEIFGKSINDQGFIVDAETGKLIITPDDEPITPEEFGAIKKGSEIFLKKDLLTTIKLAENKY